MSYISMRDALMNINEGSGDFPVGHVNVEVTQNHNLLPVAKRAALKVGKNVPAQHARFLKVIRRRPSSVR